MRGLGIGITPVLGWPVECDNLGFSAFGDPNEYPELEYWGVGGGSLARCGKVGCEIDLES